MKTDIFHLQIIAIDDILPHELFDQSRIFPLLEKIKRDKVFTNPIIVASMGGNKYIQLDGMNRYSAFKKLGFKSILCQIIDYNDQESVELSSWVHLFPGGKKDFIDYVRNDLKLKLEKGMMGNVGYRYIKEEGFGRLCTFITKKGEVYLISGNGNLVKKMENLRLLVHYFQKNITRDVLPSKPNATDIELLFAEHENGKNDLMIVYPTFTRHQIVELVRKNVLFPSGITRHIIKRRCLNLNVPLSVFDIKRSVKNQNREFEKILEDRTFRLYEEPTIYFE